ncbi:hypothetical protein BWI96_16745 [Siphonobacter sp. SORGH_AS_0500]|nr:hypothetical protein BWI96_16745 [Siphonobacter sp. SORGH_AS_0500]
MLAYLRIDLRFMLSLKQVIHLMEQLSARKQGFVLTFVTADKQRPEDAGRVIELQNAILSKHDRLLPKEIHQEIRRDEHREFRKNPAHDVNGTINIHILGNREIRKVHPWLITHFNGQEVL